MNGSGNAAGGSIGVCVNVTKLQWMNVLILSINENIVNKNNGKDFNDFDRNVKNLKT